MHIEPYISLNNGGLQSYIIWRLFASQYDSNSLERSLKKLPCLLKLFLKPFYIQPITYSITVESLNPNLLQKPVVKIQRESMQNNGYVPKKRSGECWTLILRINRIAFNAIWKPRFCGLRVLRIVPITFQVWKLSLKSLFAVILVYKVII